MSINVGTAVAYLELDSSKFTAGLKTAQESLKGVSNDSSTFADKMTSVGSGLKQAGAAISLVSVPLLGLGVGAVKTAADFEAGMSKVEALSGSTAEEMKMLESVAREMGSTTVYSSSEAAEALSYMSLAGWDANQMAAGLEPTLKLAGAAGMDLAQASDIVTDTLSMFGMSAEEATVLTDSLAYAQANSNTSVEQLGEALKYCGASANAMGYDIQDTTALLGVLADSGLKGSVAGTTLNAVFRDMKGAIKDGSIELAGHKIAIDDGTGSYRDMEDILDDVISATAEMSDIERDAALSSIFGTEALKGMNIMLETGTDRLGEFEDGIRGSDGAANEMYDTMQNNLNGALSNLSSAFEGMLITIGNALLPTMQAIVDKITSWCTWFNTLDSGTQLIIIGVGSFIAILGALLIIIGQLIIACGAIVGAFSGITIAGLSLGGAFSFLMTSILPVIAIFAAVIAVGYLLVENWDWICAKGSELWGNFTSWFTSCIEKTVDDFKQNWEESCQAVANWWEWVKATGSNIWEAITSIIKAKHEAIKLNIQTVWQFISNFFNTVLNVIKSIVQSVFDGIKAIVSSIMQGISNQINLILNTIKTIFSNVLGLIKGIVTLDFGLIKSSITNILNAVKNFCSQTWSNILNTCSSILGNITGTVKNIFDGIKNSIATGLRNAYNTALGWWDNIKNIFKNPISAVVNIFKNDNTRAVSGYNTEDMEVASMKTRDFNLDTVNYVFSSAKTATGTLTTRSLVDLTKDLKEQKINTNNTQNISINLNIDKVENSNERNIEDLANELAFYIKRKNIGMGMI